MLRKKSAGGWLGLGFSKFTGGSVDLFFGGPSRCGARVGLVKRRAKLELPSNLKSAAAIFRPGDKPQEQTAKRLNYNDLLISPWKEGHTRRPLAKDGGPVVLQKLPATWSLVGWALRKRN
jgi:hypothetical protein